MDVTDLLSDIFRRPEIPVVASASLPEPVMALTIRLPIFHIREGIRCIGADPRDSSFGHRCFHGYQDMTDPNVRMRKHHHVYVLRHKDIGEKIVKTASSTRFEGFCEPLTTSRT